jgi:hypothetical protein
MAVTVKAKVDEMETNCHHAKQLTESFSQSGTIQAA